MLRSREMCLIVGLTLLRLDLSICFEDLEGPNFTHEPPSNVDFSNNTGARLDCVARGNPVPTVKWVLLDGKTVRDVKGVRAVWQNGTLSFPPFRTEEYRQDVHAAIYRCQASNILGTVVSRDVRLRAVVMQVYEAQVYDEFVIRGNTAVLRCHIPSFVADYVSVSKWIVDETTQIQSSAESGDRYSILASGELYIRDVGVNDGHKDYRCLTTHRLTGETRKSATAGRLFVTEPQGSVPPRITGSKANVQEERGRTAVIPCAAQGYPIPTYSWLKKLSKTQVVPITENDRVQLIGGTLVVREAQHTDAGIYICVVNNSVGVERIETTIVITAPLEVRVEPALQKADIGKPATLKCVVSGFPVLSISWMKDGRPLTSDKNRPNQSDVLRIGSVQKTDSGMYQCLVRNEGETAQGIAEIKLGDSMPELREVFKDETLRPESTSMVNLKCVSTGNPPPQITWLRDGAPLPNRRIQTGSFVTPNGDLVSHVNISNPHSEDGGDYKCTARNRVGAVEHTGRLNIYGHPYIRPMHKVSIVAGDKLILKCPVTGYPISAILWEKEGTVLPVDFRQEVFPNGTLVVQNVQRTADTGKYTCSASAPDGRTNRRDVEVSVMVAPKIVPFSFQDEILREGTRARLQCVVSEGEVPLTIRWTKDGKPIPHDLGVAVRDLDEFSSILTINNVSSRQNGRYTCVVNNEAASVNHSAVLHVNVPPRWVHEPSDMDVMVGKSVLLDCQAEGFPKPSISWMKVVGSGSRQSIQNNVQYQLLNNGSLRLLSADENDRGHYFCLANNGIGAGLSKMVHLNVRVPVKFDMKYRHESIKRGSDAVLICQVRGDPPVQLTWQLNDQNIQFSTEPRFAIKDTPQKNGLISELRILRVERQDSATFACIAKNAYGRDETSIQLVVLETADSPKNVKVLEHSSRTVHLSWTQPYDGNSPITKYLAQYKPSSATWRDGASNATIVSAESSAVVQGLLPATEYQFRVFAENEVGRSEPSDIVQVITDEEAPNGPPMDIRVQSVGSESLVVTWKPPRKSQWNGELFGYNVGYKVYESSDPYSFRTVEVSGDAHREMSLTLSELRKFTKYSIIIRAFNKVGTGPTSEEVIEQTAEDVPTLAPESVECVALSSQSVQVAWQPPPQHSIHGILQGYKVVYKPTEEWYDASESETKITSALRTTIHGLERFSNYSIQVLAFTRVGDGQRSNPVYCNTMEDVPDAPADIKALPTAATGLLVVWKPPSNRNGAVTKYSVYMRSVDHGKEDTVKQTVPQSTTFHEVSGLKKNRRYELWVTASTSVGEGQSTHVVSVTLSGPPVPARIAGFDDLLVAALGSEVNLPCRSVGIPAPDREWRNKGHPVEKTERFVLQQDGTLNIRDIQSSDVGNYTCHVWNSQGTDEITYTILVQVPPPPPELTIAAVTTSSISLKWKALSDGGMPVLGYMMHYKREYGEWEEVSLPPDHHSYTLHNLECGTRYNAYVTAKNRIGTGEASQTISAKTDGAAPTIPPKEKLIDASASYITLHLDSWNDPLACPILYFVVQHKKRGDSDWTLVSNNVLSQQSQFIIPDLEPATWYGLQMTAHNSAGSTVAQYDFATLTLSGVTLASEPALNDSTDDGAGYLEIRVFASIIVSVLLVVFALVLTCFLTRRRKSNGQKEPVRTEQYEKANTDPKTYTNNSTSGSFTYLLSNSSERPRSHLVTDFERKGETRQSSNPYTADIGINPTLLNGPPQGAVALHEDVCPYATFQLAENERDHVSAEELRTFSQRRNVSLNVLSGIEDMYSKVRKTTPLQRSRPSYHYPESQAFANQETERMAKNTHLQLQARHPCTTPGMGDHHVPDLLEHGPESGSSNEGSPTLAERQPSFLGHNRTGSLGGPLRQHRPESRYYEDQPQTAETTLVFNERMDMFLPYYDGHHFPEIQCNRDRPYRPN